MKNLELSDVEAEALIQELSGHDQLRPLPFLASHPNPAGDPPEAEARAGPRAAAAATELGARRGSGDVGGVGDARPSLALIGLRLGGKMVSEPAKVFEDRLRPGDWRVEWEDDDGGVEVTIFSGPDARERAFQYADWRYRVFT